MTQQVLSLLLFALVRARIVEVPWQFQVSVPPKTEANNSFMLMNILRFYLQSQGLTDFIPQVEDMLQYGCWCQILRERLAGKGLPTDDYDVLCQDWQRCNECAVMDFEETSTNCNAATTLYEVSFSTVTRRIVCDKTSDPCGKAICQCDESLAFRLASATEIFAEVFNESTSHTSFDFNSTCVWQHQANLSRDDKRCCGTYPNRVPFHHQNYQRECCGDSIIHSDTHCCADGVPTLGDDPTCST